MVILRYVLKKNVKQLEELNAMPGMLEALGSLQHYFSQGQSLLIHCTKPNFRASFALLFRADFHTSFPLQISRNSIFKFISFQFCLNYNPS